MVSCTAREGMELILENENTESNLVICQEENEKDFLGKG